MNYKEDLAYANTILKIRNMMEDRTILKHPTVKSFNSNACGIGFSIEPDDIQPGIFGYLEIRRDHLGGSQHWFSTHTLVAFSRDFAVTVNDYEKDYFNILVPDDNEITEEWYFQQSLLHNEFELRGLVVHKTLLKHKSKFDYFQLKLKYVDSIMGGL